MPRDIMIACVTVEVAMVVSPVLRYRPQELHLFRYISDSGNKKSKLYRDHYNKVVRRISESLPSCKIIEHSDEPVYEVNRMARSLDKLYYRISKDNDDFRILANLSSGPSEFAAALGIFSYVHPPVVLFKVPTREYAVSQSMLEEFYYDNGVPVGLTRKTYPPKEITGIRLELPDERRLRALRLYHSMMEGGTEPYLNRMVPALKEQGLWEYEPAKEDLGSDLALREKMYYFRHYRQYWKEMGWIEEEKRRSPRLTAFGLLDGTSPTRDQIMNESIRQYFLQIYNRYSERADANDYVLMMMEEVGQ